MIEPMFRRVASDLLLAITCLALLAPTGARAATPDTVFLEDLTWTEVRDAIRAGKTTIIIPAGGTEQNGPHMALGKHNARVRVLSERIARSLGDALVAPVIAYVPEASMGTAIEMWEAHRSGKAVVAVSPLVHNWVIKFCSTCIFPDIESLEAEIVSGKLAQRLKEYLSPT